MSDELTVDLSQHQFATNMKLFKQDKIMLKHKNFIFAKNGSGKSTFANLIQSQMGSTYNVQLFQGLEKYLGENQKLDAFSLAVDAGENEELIALRETEKAEQEQLLTDVQNQLIAPDNLEIENLYTKLKQAESDKNDKHREIDNFYKQSASKISNMKDPQISGKNYNKNNFKVEKLAAKELSQIQIDNFKSTLKSNLKIAKEMRYSSVDLSAFLSSTNKVLTSKVEEKIKIARLNTPEKKNFAAKGLQIHEHQESVICAFCGNHISQSTFTELESYFSADDVNQLKDKILKEKELIDLQIQKMEKLTFSDSEFYADFKQRAREEFDKIDNSKNVIKNFLQELKINLEKKEKNLFEDSSPVQVEISDNIDVSVFNSIVDENNKFGEDLSNKKEEARKALRYHEIKIALDKVQFDIKETELTHAEGAFESAKKDWDQKNKEKQVYENKINLLNQEIEKLKPKAERQAVEHINQKLKSLFSWYVDYKEDENSGYYHIAEKRNSSVFYRGVSDLSTGEKNIIAFLYFIEKLEEINDTSQLPKIIIFDDPMNSNDDTMQYLIITEMQKIYQGKQQAKYNPNKDYFIVMTHNVHFYLNVPPHGNFKDSNRKTKYDKNNFYRLHKGNFQQITSEKDDFKTNYDAIWSELSELAELDLRNSMLNSMRRIIETYLDFTNIKQDDFYQGNEQYLKLFNVNSHGAIDSISSEAFTETADELIQLFYLIFRDNNSTDHFDAHWKGKTISL